MHKTTKIKHFAGVAALAGFFLMAYIVVTGVASGFDDSIRSIFYELRNESLTPVVKIITYLGNWQTIVLFCIILLSVRPLRINYGLPVSVGAIAVTVINKMIKHIVQRVRPEDITHLIDEGGFSFASGHAAVSMFFYGMLIYLVRSNVKEKKKANITTIFLALPMILIGLSRIYLGVHYPTDVIAGWCIGIVMISLVSEVVEKKNLFEGKQK